MITVNHVLFSLFIWFILFKIINYYLSFTDDSCIYIFYLQKHLFNYLMFKKKRKQKRRIKSIIYLKNTEKRVEIIFLIKRKKKNLGHLSFIIG